MKRFWCALVSVALLGLNPAGLPGQKKPFYEEKPAIEEEQDKVSGQELRVAPRPRPGHDGFSVRIYTPRQHYYLGDSVRVSFRSSRDAYVYIYSTDARGRTTQIFPNYYDRDNFVQGGVNYTIPDSSYDLVAEPPLGRETISIVAVRGKYRVPDRYRTFSRSEPFIQAEEGRAAIKAVVPRDKRSRLVAEDSTTIWVRGHDYYRY